MLALPGAGLGILGLLWALISNLNKYVFVVWGRTFSLFLLKAKVTAGEWWGVPSVDFSDLPTCLGARTVISPFSVRKYWSLFTQPHRATEWLELSDAPSSGSLWASLREIWKGHSTGRAILRRAADEKGVRWVINVFHSKLGTRKLQQSITPCDASRLAVSLFQPMCPRLPLSQGFPRKLALDERKVCWR